MNILHIEKMYKSGIPAKQKFSISVPRVSYISNAFARFSNSINASSAEIFYKETNSSKAIKNILTSDYRLGIIRYAANYDKYFKASLEEKGLSYELIYEFHYVLIMSKENPLAKKDEIHYSDLKPFIKIAHADPHNDKQLLILEEQTLNTVTAQPPPLYQTTGKHEIIC